MVNEERPWSGRGGTQNNKTGAGVFYFGNWYGSINGDSSFRLAL